MKTSRHHDKIHEALDLLNEAAKEKKEELYGMIGDRYAEIRELLSGQAENGVEFLHQAKKRVAKELHAEEARVRRNPWPYLGAAAFVALVAGMALGKK